MNSAKSLCAPLLFLLLPLPLLHAQTNAEPKSAQTDTTPHPARPHFGEGLDWHTFYLRNASAPNDGNEILTALRVMLDPSVRLYLTPFQNAISIRASAADIAFAQRIVDDLDKPKKAYRLTYTVATLDSGKRVGDQHFTVIITSGGRTTLKQGSRVPIITGSYDSAKQGQETQFTYLDVGLSIQVHLETMAGGARLETKIEQSSIGEIRQVSSNQDPVVRQTQLEGTALLEPGKPTMLGSLDVPDTDRHLDISVQMDPIP